MRNVLKPTEVLFGDADNEWKSEEPLPYAGLSIKDVPDRYLVSPIFYRGVAHEVGVCKTLLGTKDVRSLPEWNDYLIPHRLRIPSGPLLFSLFDALRQDTKPSSTKAISDIRSMFEEDYGESGPLWMPVSTVIRKNRDKAPTHAFNAVHDAGMPDEWVVKYPLPFAEHVDPDEQDDMWNHDGPLEGNIRYGGGQKGTLEALVGIRSPGRVNDIGLWFGRKRRPYLGALADPEKDLFLRFYFDWAKQLVITTGLAGQSSVARAISLRKLSAIELERFR